MVLDLGSAVLKITAAGMYPDGGRMFELVHRAAPGLVPEFLDRRGADGEAQAMLFRPFVGTPVDCLSPDERREGLVEMARTTARIQDRVRRLEPQGLTAVRAADVPAMLDELLEGAVSRCRADHADRWRVECAKQEVSEDLAQAVRPWRETVAAWAAELEAGGWSGSIDHVDLLPHNADVLRDGSLLVYDWEQATLGVPFFSLDVLLAYAQCVDEGGRTLDLRPERPTPTQDRMRPAYLAELPGPLELALRLAPIRYAWAEWRQAEAANVPHYGIDDVAWWLTRALRRWERA